MTIWLAEHPKLLAAENAVKNTQNKLRNIVKNTGASMNQFRLINEQEATPAYELKKHLSLIFDGWQYENDLKNYLFLVANGDLSINGDLQLDYEDNTWASDSLTWRKSLNIDDDETLKNNYGIRGVIVTGNLTVNGTIKNSDMESGAFLMVMGNVAAHKLVAGGAHMQINGKATIRDYAYGHYNDGSIQISGDLSVPIFINDDHDFGIKSLINNQFSFNSNNYIVDSEDDDGTPIIPKKLRALLKDDLLDWSDLTSAMRAGNAILKLATEKNAAVADKDWAAILQRDGAKLRLVPKVLLTAELCQIAVASNGEALNKVPAKLLNQSIIETAIKQNSDAIEMVPKKWMTQALARLAVEHGANLRDIRAELIDADMAKVAVSGYYQNLYSVPQHLITRDLLSLYFTNHTAEAGDLQPFFKSPREYDLQDIVLEIAKISLEKFDRIPPMYVTETVHKAAESLYKNDPNWIEVCRKHGCEAKGKTLTKDNILAAINNDKVEKVDYALDHIWNYLIDESVLLSIMYYSYNFNGISNIPHQMMTPKVIEAMLADSLTHVQYLPHDKLSEKYCLRAVKDWHTNLSCIDDAFKSLAVCKAALGRCKADDDYLMDEVLAAIPVRHKAVLGLA